MIAIKPIKEISKFKRSFNEKFKEVRKVYASFDDFIEKIPRETDVYVVGGFLRDIHLGGVSRDIDIIIGLESSKLDEIVRVEFEDKCVKNRMGGYKLRLNNFDIDFWSIDSNWAFKNRMIKRNEKYLLDGIAKGCFYNFDSLVINTRTFELNVKYFNECANAGTLDIVLKKHKYQSHNPTREANIIRAFYLKKKYEVKYAQNLISYLEEQIDAIEHKGEDPLEYLNKFQTKYEKYKNLSEIELEKDIVYVRDCYYNNKVTANEFDNNVVQLKLDV